MSESKNGELHTQEVDSVEQDYEFEEGDYDPGELATHMVSSLPSSVIRKILIDELKSNRDLAEKLLHQLMAEIDKSGSEQAQCQGCNKTYNPRENDASTCTFYKWHTGKPGSLRLSVDKFLIMLR